MRKQHTSWHQNPSLEQDYQPHPEHSTGEKNKRAGDCQTEQPHLPPIHSQTHTDTDTHRHRHRHRHTDRDRDRDRDRDTDRQTDRHRHTHTHAITVPHDRSWSVSCIIVFHDRAAGWVSEVFVSTGTRCACPRGVIGSTVGAYPRGTGSNPVEGNGHFFPSCRQLYILSFSDTHTRTRTYTAWHMNNTYLVTQRILAKHELRCVGSIQTINTVDTHNSSLKKKTHQQ